MNKSSTKYVVQIENIDDYLFASMTQTLESAINSLNNNISFLYFFLYCIDLFFVDTEYDLKSRR